MTIYLCGAINGRTTEDCCGWRAEAKRLLAGHAFLDPTRNDYRGRESGNEREIVEQDKADILACDAVLAHVPEPSFGSAMEILFAWEQRKPVVAVSTSGSPWLGYHAAVVPALAEAADLLLAYAEPECRLRKIFGGNFRGVDKARLREALAATLAPGKNFLVAKPGAPCDIDPAP